MMAERSGFSSLISGGISLYVGDWKSQAIIYGFTFFIALSAALIADLGLGKSEASVALFTAGLVIVLLLLTPLIPAKLLADTALRHKVYAELHQSILSLQRQVEELTKKAEAAYQPYEIPLTADVETDLGMLVSDSKAVSSINYLQDLIYKELADLRFESMYATGERFSLKLMLPIGMKGLLEHLATVKGFSSVEEYLADSIRSRTRKLQEREKVEKEEQAKRRRFIEGPRPYAEQHVPKPSTEPGSIFLDRKFNSNRFQPLIPEHSAGAPEEI